jgi:hypothetical protein
LRLKKRPNFKRKKKRKRKKISWKKRSDFQNAIIIFLDNKKKIKREERKGRSKKLLDII